MVAAINSDINYFQDEIGLGYVRQSKERKDRESISPDTQKEKISKFAELQDTILAEYFQDIDISGFKVHYSKRPGLTELLEYVKTHNVKKVYVYNLSRLSRRIKEFIEITDTLEEYGCSVVSVTEMIDMSTPQGRLFRNILLSFNEYYSDSLSATITDNHKKNVQLKKWNGGNAPFGYDWNKEKQQFVENNDYPTLLEMIEKAVSLWGPKKISNHFNLFRKPSPNGGKWTNKTVKYILTNPFYRGYLQYDGELYESPLAKKVMNNEQWEAIQENLSRFEGLGPRGKVSPHLLTGLIVCNGCGSRYEVRYNGSTRVRRYICSGRQHSTGECKSLLLDADSIESAIVEHIHKLVTSTFFDEIVSESNKKSTPTLNVVQAEIKELEKKLSAIVLAQEELYEDTFVQKMIKKERFYEMNSKFETDRTSLEEEIKKLYSQIETTDTSYILDYREELKDALSIFNNLSHDEQRTVVHSYIESINVFDTSLEIVLPMSKTQIKSTSIKRGTMFFG